MIRAHGPDLSGWQLKFNAEIPKWKFDFVYNKYSEGRLDYIHDYPEEERRKNQDQMLEESLKVPVRGGYHFIRSDHRWKDQADTYLECVEKLRDDGYKTHFHVLDGGERASNEFTNEFANFHYEWYKYVNDNVPEVLFNYMSTGSAKELLVARNHTWQNKVPYIVAQYWWDYYGWKENNLDLRYNGANPNLWTGRDNWQMWQVTGLFPGRTEGVTGSMSMDYNVWNGSANHMRAYLGIRNIIRRTFHFPRNNRIRMA